MNKSTLFLVGLLSWLSVSGPGLCEDLDLVAKLKRDYNYENWVGNTATNYRAFVTNWTPDFSSIGVTSFVWTRVGTYTNATKESAYDFVPADAANVRITMHVIERASVTNAHEAIIEALSRCTYGHPFSVTNSLGDRCYFRGSTGRAVWLSRINVFFSMSADTKTYSVLPMATRFDQQLLGISAGK